jgi:hypothetical protein
MSNIIGAPPPATRGDRRRGNAEVGSSRPNQRSAVVSSGSAILRFRIRHVGLLCLALIAASGLPERAHGQDSPFAPPPGVQKFSFYPQGGNFFGDLFPTNFVDLDSTSGILAYNGTDYTYDGHDGCDTEILGFPAQAVGVPIFAVLDGTVTVAHDGEPDMNTSFNSGAVANRVVLDHGNGQHTLYFHMKTGSVAVTVGQQVKAGQQIGLTGSSGDSTAPHLHFQTQVNGQVYEPFAGTARPGDSGWVSQPPFRTDLYLREFVMTDQDLSTWSGFPYDTTRTGTFLSGSRLVGFWAVLGNGQSTRKISVRYLRPDDSVALAPAAYNTTGVSRNGVFNFQYQVNLDVTGVWHLEVSINDQLLVRAPFRVMDSTPFPNRAPSAIQVAFDPAAPSPNDVIFCRVTSSPILLDPDYDLVRYHYVWKVNGNVVRDVVSAGLADAIPHDSANSGDSVTCTVTPSDGTMDGPPGTAAISLSAPQLLNVSTRMQVLGDDQVLIGGFIVKGTEPKQVIIRGLGPSVPVAGALADPTLELHDANGTIATNDNWKINDQSQQSQENDVRVTGIPPSNDLESVILATLPANNSAYTAILRGKNGGTGIGLVEVYDLNKAANSKLANISTRGFIDTGDNVMIGGFIAGPNTSSSGQVLLRAIGPSLPVSGALQDPMLELHNGNGTTVATNDNWKIDDATQQSQEAAIRATGAPPTDDRESALVQAVVPGSYTAIVRGSNHTTGVGLVEVYNLQ